MKPGSERRRWWTRRGRRVAIVVSMVIVLVELIGFFVVPRVIASLAPERITDALGRKAAIGTVRFNPLTLAATLDDVRLYQPDGRTVAFRADRLRIDLSSASLFRRALVFDALRVEKPVIHVARLTPDRYDFSDIVDKLAAQPKNEHPLPYSINNIEVDDGTVDIDDRVSGRTHVVDRMRIGLPFVSDLPYDATIFVTPAFDARIDGSPFSLTGKAQPFSATREAVVAFDVADLDLTQYMSLAPTTLPFAVVSGRLTAKLALTFTAATTDAAGKSVPQALGVSGQLTIATLAVSDRAGRHALGASSIAVDIAKLDPLAGAVLLKSIAIDAPDVEATRGPDGSIDLVDLFRMPATASPSSSATASKSAAAPFGLGALSITRGRVRFVDRMLATPQTITLKNVEATVGNVALPAAHDGGSPTPYRVSLASDDGLTIAAEGSAVLAKKQVDGALDVRGFAPARFAPYLAGVLAARIDAGSVDAHARYRLDASGPTVTGLVDEASLHVAGLRTSLPDDRATLLAAETIAVDGASFDLGKRAFTAGSLAVTAPVVAIRRDAKGRFNLQAAMVAARPVTPAVAPPAATSVVEAAPVRAPPFTALVRSLSIVRGDVTFDDLSGPAPVHVRAQPLELKASDVGTASDAATPFTIDSGIDRRGRLVVDGKVTPATSTVDAHVDASQVPVGWLAGFAGDRINIVIDSADLDTKGVLHAALGKATDAALALSYQGALRISRLRARDRETSEPFVEWKTLDVPSLDLRVPPAPGRVAIAVGEVALTDFYARVIVNANGRLNLQDVVTKTGARQSVTMPEADAGAAAAPVALATPPVVQKPADRTASPSDGAPGPAITVAGVRLANGRIGITDNFIKPNYSATLTDLVGGIAALSTETAKPSALKLAGRIDGEGTLAVDGSVDPFAATAFTDISATAKDIELTRLTPYAIKYAGYAIDRGKLSMTVRYHIEHDRLQASNRLFLDQLTFGAHDPSSAADLPVRLAVALLANAKGEIDVELPISGSLADPQFSIGSVLGHALLNLVARAVTSPFALIGSAFGGAGGANGELGYIQFRPGVSDLTDLGKSKLVTLATALADRPALKLDIIGRYDPATDPDGIARDHLLDKLKDLKAAALSKTGERVSRDDVTIADAAEHDRLVTQLYDATKLADKPRNVVGLAKAVPAADMERLLLADIKLAPDDPRWLAEARADVVRHYIEDTGKIAAGRVFLVTPKLNADGITDHGVANRVDFALR